MTVLCHRLTGWEHPCEQAALDNYIDLFAEELPTKPSRDFLKIMNHCLMFRHRKV